MQLCPDREPDGPAGAAHADARTVHKADGLQPVGDGEALPTPQETRDVMIPFFAGIRIRIIPLSHFWISAACGENINFALPPLLEFGLTKYDFSPKSHFFVFFQPKFQEGVAYFSSYLRHGGMTIEFSSSGH